MKTTRGPLGGEVSARYGPDAVRAVPVANIDRSELTGQIEIIHHPVERFYELLDDGTSTALLIYENDGHRIVITHAMVREERRGNGLGTTLIASALDDLTAAGAKVGNYCASVAAFLDKHPDYKTLVDGAETS